MYAKLDLNYNEAFAKLVCKNSLKIFRIKWPPNCRVKRGVWLNNLYTVVDAHE